MSLMHNIRNFAEIQLQGIIPWSKFSFPDETHTDVANVSIEGKHGLYRIVVSSSYAVPPLGKVVFKDHSQGHEIEGQNQDETWHRIAEYLKAAEAGETINVEQSVRAIPGAVVTIPAPIVHFPANEIQVPPIAFVYYISDPGVWYQNGPALVTRVNADGSYNLTVFPDGSDPFYRQNVGQRSDMLRNICWVEYKPAVVVLNKEPMEAAQQNAEIAELRALVTELQDKIGMLKQSAFDQRKSA